MSGGLIFFGIVALIVLVAILKTAVIVPQKTAYIVERLGKYRCTLDAGFHILVPFIDHIAYRHTLKEQAIDVPPQQCITKDNIAVDVDGILYMQVMDPAKASYGIGNYLFATTQLAQTTMRSEMGKLDLDRSFEERTTINAAIVSAVDKASDPWGIKVTRYEIKNITPPRTIRDAMESVAAQAAVIEQKALRKELRELLFREASVRSEKAKEHALETGNYDLTREHLNFQVSKGGKIEPIDKSKSIPAMIAENLLARGIEDPNAKNPERRYRTVVNFILGGSRERMHEIAFGNQKVNLDKGADNAGIRRTKDIEHWAQDMYQFMCDRYGEDNVVAFYVHLDELNPHVHCTVLPITQDNKFSYKKIFAGKDKFEHRRRTLALHDALAKVNEKWGLGRGTSISETGARHRSTEEYRRHLEQECSNLQESIINHKRALSDLIVEMQLAEKRSKGLTTMIENLEKQKGDIEKELDNLRKQIRNTNGDKTYLQLQKDKLEKNLNDINSKLADKQAKLENADQKLTQLKADYDEIKQRADELKEEARASAVTVQKNIHTELTCALYENVVSDFKMRLPVLDKSLLKAFED